MFFKNKNKFLFGIKLVEVCYNSGFIKNLVGSDGLSEFFFYIYNLDFLSFKLLICKINFYKNFMLYMVYILIGV